MDINAYHIIATIIAIVGIFVGVLGRKESQQADHIRDNNQAIWKNIETLRADIDKLEQKIYQDYHNKIAIKEYIDLILQPILHKIEHVEAITSDINQLLKANSEDRAE